MIDRQTADWIAALGFAASTRAMGQPESIFVGPQIPFSFEKLIASAKELSERPYQKPVVHDPALVERIDFDAYQQIKFQPELAIWGGGDGPYPIELFHVGRFFKEPVRIFVVQRRGRRRRLAIVPTFLPMGKRICKGASARHRFCGVSHSCRAGRAGLACIPWSVLLPQSGRNGTIWTFIPRSRHRRRHANAGGISSLFAVLAGTDGGAARRDHQRIAGFTAYRRRLPLRDHT